MEPVYVAKSREEKAMQRALMQCHIRKNWALIRKALRQAERDDLIGNGGGCLVPPDYQSTQTDGYRPKQSGAKPQRQGGGGKRGTDRKPSRNNVYGRPNKPSGSSGRGGKRG